MNKTHFMELLAIRLRKEGASKAERENILGYYQELIDDQIEEGYREEWIIERLGSIDEIISTLSIDHKIKEKPDKKPKSTAYWVIIGCLFPLWIALFGVALGLIGAGIGITIGLISIVFAFLVVSIAFSIGGFAGMFVAFINFQDGFNHGLYAIGVSLAVLGIGLILLPISSKLFKECLSIISSAVRKIGYILKR